MTRRLALMAVMLASFLLSAGSAQAEMRITVPFDFSVGKALLPAGTYTIGKMGAAQTLLQIRNNEVNTGTIQHIHYVELEHGQASDADKLVFNRYGDQYFLSQLWVAGSTTGLELPRSKVEVEVENASKRKSQVVWLGSSKGDEFKVSESRSIFP